MKHRILLCSVGYSQISNYGPRAYGFTFIEVDPLLIRNFSSFGQPPFGLGKIEKCPECFDSSWMLQPQSLTMEK